MYFLVLATDYDGTIAEDGTVSAATLAALERLKTTGRKLILVTGRGLPDLERVFPELAIFDRIVAENGALLYTPSSKEERALAPAPTTAFIQRLAARGVEPLSVGRSIVATWEPHEGVVLEAIRDLGLELEIVFNKGAVMVLPSGINKSTGLAAALEELELSPHNVVGVGDAENDHAFLRAVGFGVAVANALPTVKETADRVTKAARGAGVVELIAALVESDSAALDAPRHHIELGLDASGEPVRLVPYGGGALLAGSSGIGKSTLATALTERFVERGFQFCVFDPEGDYDGLENAVVVGDTKNPPSTREILDLLKRPDVNVVVNTLALELAERPNFFADLFPEIASLRAKAGRPHWLIVDEAHHLMPAARDSASLALPKELPATILITVHPDSVSQDALAQIELVIALGPDAGEVVTTFCAVTDAAVPDGLARPGDSEVLFWNRKSDAPAKIVTVTRPRQAHKRHTRKYAEGELGEDDCFYFRGPEQKLNLRAQNLATFLLLAEGVDDDTWQHHLRAGDYSNWFRNSIKDDDLAEEVAAIEASEDLDPTRSRANVAETVRRRYTAPASAK